MSEPIDSNAPSPEEKNQMDRRRFLLSAGKWSGAAILAALGIASSPNASAGVWVNRRGGVGVGIGGGGSWVNRRGGGGWVNRSGGGGWLNRPGGWINRPSSWINRGGSWFNSRSW